jgi:hypothetical protein
MSGLRAKEFWDQFIANRWTFYRLSAEFEAARGERGLTYF